MTLSVQLKTRCVARRTSSGLLFPLWLLALLLCGHSSISMAGVHALKDGETLIGKPTAVVSTDEDSLYTIALRYRMGAGAVAHANQDVDPWLVGEGTKLTLPTQLVLPSVEREGIVINLPEMRLYYFPPDLSSVVVYPVGIGRQGWDTPLLESRITSIVKNPTWTPPASIHREYKKAGLSLPDVVPAGKDNPLGGYAIRIGQTDYLIHGTNNPKGVGLRVSHGCIRLYPEHIEELVSLIEPGTSVRIINQPIKIGRQNDVIYLQAHQPVNGDAYDHSAALKKLISHAENQLTPSELARVKSAIRQSLKTGELYSGIPLLIDADIYPISNAAR